MVFGQGPPATGSLAGRVVDATSKAGIRKATVYATAQVAAPVPGEGPRFSPATIYSTLTDDGGVYRFAVLPAGPIGLRAEKAGYLQGTVASRERTAVRVGEEATAAEIILLKQAHQARALALAKPTLSLDELAIRYGRSAERYMRLLRLSYLSPAVVEAIVASRQPPRLTNRFLQNLDG